MKFALHFDENSKTFGNRIPFFSIAQELFPLVLKLGRPKISSQVFVGSLLIHSYAYKCTSETRNSRTERFDTALFKQILTAWANPPAHLFSTIAKRAVDTASNGGIFAVCFGCIDREQAGELDASLQKMKAYLGAVEVDETYPPHNLLYAHGLCAFGRMFGSEFRVFWDGVSEDSKDVGVVEMFRETGFREVTFESLEGRYSIFDSKHTPEVTLKIAESKQLCEGLMASLSETVLEALTDAAPELPEKLHAALTALRAAETAEQCAQVSITCRRIIEYVTDCLFPPQSAPVSGRKLDKTAYRNRLLAYADESRNSNTSIDLIVASTATMAEQLQRLEAAVNKGVHADILDVEARRCVVRTIMLLDDLISLKDGPFRMKPKLNFDGFLSPNRKSAR